MLGMDRGRANWVRYSYREYSRECTLLIRGVGFCPAAGLGGYVSTSAAPLCVDSVLRGQSHGLPLSCADCIRGRGGDGNSNHLGYRSDQWPVSHCQSKTTSLKKLAAAHGAGCGRWWFVVLPKQSGRQQCRVHSTPSFVVLFYPCIVAARFA